MGVLWNHTLLSFSALAFGRPTLADRLTIHDVLLFAAPLTLSQNLDASIVNDGLGALNFQAGRGLWHSAPDVSILMQRHIAGMSVESDWNPSS